MEEKRNEYTRILAAADSMTVQELGKLITDRYRVRSLRPAQKTLVMIQVREPVGASRFYLGEAVCSECMVEIDGNRGFAAFLGDDFEKVTAAAVIDAAFRARVPETEILRARIEELGEKQKESRREMNRKIRKSRVDFQTMGEQ